MNRVPRIRFIGKILVALFAIAIICGCMSPRTGKYFISTREAGKRWGYAGSYWGEPMGYVKAGITSFPTVVGPFYYWFVRPVYDTVDWLIISPTVDVVCLPLDFYLRTWRRVRLHFVDETGKPCVGVRIRLPSGNVQTSDADGDMDFMTWVETNDDCSPKLLNEEYYQKSYISFQRYKETYGKRYVPVTKVQEIRLRRKQKLSPCTDVNIVTFMPGFNKAVAFDLFAKDWLPPYGSGVETNLLIEMRFEDPTTDLFVTLPGDKSGGFSAFRRVYGGDDCAVHEWMKWGQNTNIIQSLEIMDQMGTDDYAFCIRADSHNQTNNVYGVIMSLGIPFNLWSTGIPMLNFRYRLNDRGIDWFEWAEDYRVKVPILFRTQMVDVTDDGIFHLKDVHGKDVWLRRKDDGNVIRYYNRPAGRQQ